MTFTITLKDILTLTTILFGGGGILTFILKNKGLITFGKPVERRHFIPCDNHTLMHEDIRAMKDEIIDLKKILDGINFQVIQHMEYHAGRERKKQKS